MQAYPPGRPLVHPEASCGQLQHTGGDINAHDLGVLLYAHEVP